MQRSHKIRMYPTREQEVQLLKTAGTARYAFNWALDRWKSMYEEVEKGLSDVKPTAFILSGIWTREKPSWACETARCAQQQAIMNVGVAFKNLWKGHCSYLKFKKKGHRDSFYIQNSKAWIKGKTISLPKIGKIKLAEPLRFPGKIISYTVSTYAGQWHVSVQVDTPDQSRCSAPDSVVGIDAGLKHIATASDGSVLDAPRKLSRLQINLRNAQRKLSRKQKRSRNYTKQLLRKQKIQNKIDNIRKDAVHKYTSAITKSHGTVVVESLDIKGMREQASKGLRRSLASSMMSELIRQLEYKALRVVKVDRYFPSTKTCSSCGHVQDVSLDERTFRCEACRFTCDRDLNASYNLMKAGQVMPVVPVEAAGTGC